ncbi:oxidoreductase [Terrihabitans soli]|uniref:Oxidoreductase n=1 Tax=Terrihabitans soli TaxID=708113 RepID=A0A6S6QI69_9HYPH|nr:SDR family oxidoreductase [Terrihabitans soli]BCJ89914.1 oxidoreductase [Terrihabitans soli]
MDLNIAGKNALVCASSRGLGRACAEALAAEGVNVTINGINAETLEKTAAEIRARFPSVKVTAVRADITTVEGREALLAACASPDILINNLAGPSPKKLMETNHEDWVAGLEATMIAPLMLTQRVLPAMQERRFGRIINITSAMVTTPRSHQALSSGPRAGLTAVMKGLSLDVAKFNVTVNNLLPERLDTDRQKFMVERLVKLEGITAEQARKKLEGTIPAGRFGAPAEFGAVCAFFCSAHSGFVTGMNIHLDGGAYPALI